jgi:hypothetical protein
MICKTSKLRLSAVTISFATSEETRLVRARPSRVSARKLPDEAKLSHGVAPVSPSSTMSFIIGPLSGALVAGGV